MIFYFHLTQVLELYSKEFIYIPIYIRSCTRCVQEDKNMKRMKNNEEAVSPVIAIILMVAITVVLAGVLYMWVISLADTSEGVSIMHFTVSDGNNKDETHGCFFLIRAGKGVDIDPLRHAFFVAEKGYSPQKLDNDDREYKDSHPYGPDPASGDLNTTYDWTSDGDLWSDMEYIGFDMPKESMNIDPRDGTIYEVLIKDPKGEVIFRDTFVYSEQY